MKQQQITYARERLRSLVRRAESAIDKKFTKKKRVVSFENVRDWKRAEADKAKILEAFNEAMDEVVLGDEVQALSLIKAFAKKFAA